MLFSALQEASVSNSVETVLVHVIPGLHSAELTSRSSVLGCLSSDFNPLGHSALFHFLTPGHTAFLPSHCPAPASLWPHWLCLDAFLCWILPSVRTSTLAHTDGVRAYLCLLVSAVAPGFLAQWYDGNGQDDPCPSPHQVLAHLERPLGVE